MVEPTPTPAPVVKPEPTPTPGEPGGIPKARLDEVIGQRNDFKTQLESMQTKLDKFEADSEAAKQAKAIEEGNQSEVIADLTEKLKSAQGIVDQSLKDTAVRLDLLRAQLPEDKQKTYAGINDVTLLENLVNDFKITGGGTPGSRPSVPTEEMGGYKSWQEFSEKDPKGYSAQFKRDTAQSIQIGVSPE